MAKIIGKEPAINWSKGALRRHDRTVFNTGGQSVARYGDILRGLTQPTRGGSQARHDRAKAYCTCDQKYNQMGQACKDKLVQYKFFYGNDLQRRLTNFQFYMQLCLNGTECCFWEWAKCYTVTSSYTKEATGIRITTSLLPGISDMPVELYINDSYYSSTYSDVGGVAEFIVPYADLPLITNTLYCNTCDIHSNTMTYGVVTPIVNGDFETCDLTGWTPSGYDTRVTGGGPPPSVCCARMFTNNRWNRTSGISQDISLDNADKIKFWYSTQKSSCSPRFVVSLTPGPVLLDVYNPPNTPWTEVETDISPYSGTASLYAKVSVIWFSTYFSVYFWVDNFSLE